MNKHIRNWLTKIWWTLFRPPQQRRRVNELGFLLRDYKSPEPKPDWMELVTDLIVVCSAGFGFACFLVAAVIIGGAL